MAKPGKTKVKSDKGGAAAGKAGGKQKMAGVPKNILALGLVSFFTDVSSEMIFPLIPIVITTFMGAGKEIVGMMEGIADSIASLLDIFVGYVSDRQGQRKKFVLAGYGLSSLLKIGIAMSTIWQQIFIFRGLERIGKTLRTSPRDAIIAASSSKESLGKSFGIHRAMDTLGAITGPAIAYVILAYFGSSFDAYRAVFAAAVVPGLIAVGLIILIVREPEKNVEPRIKPKFWASLKALDSRFKSFVKVSVLFSLAYFSFALLILRANEVGIAAETILGLYLLYNIVYAAASVPAGMLADRIGRKNVIVLSFAFYAAIIAGFAFAAELWQFALLFALYGVFVSTDESVNKAYISQITKDKTRAMALGAYNSAVGAAYLPASAIAGAIWAGFGAPVAFGLSAIFALAAAAWLAVQK
ncbi:MAG: MFS transporter [Candidatus Micrarchaeia archaeon]